MIGLVVSAILCCVSVWVIMYPDWSKTLAGITLLVLFAAIASVYLANLPDEISPEVKCDRMHGVIIKEQNEKSCVERDSIKKIDLDKVFDN